MKNSTLFALATGIADLPNDDARLACARIVAHVAQIERESFDVENFAQACGIARHLAPGLLASPVAGPKLRQCEACRADGPCLWDDNSQRYVCRKCHPEPENPFFQSEPPAERPPSPWFRIFYKCPECAEEWEEEWSSACDSECPKCGTENIECDRYEDLNAEDAGTLSA